MVKWVWAEREDFFFWLFAIWGGSMRREDPKERISMGNTPPRISLF